MYNARNKMVICQLQKAKSNLPKFWKVYEWQKTKNKSSTLIYKFSRNLIL